MLKGNLMRPVLYLVKVLAWRIERVRARGVVALARLNRLRLKNTIFVGITGSAGKTTTKDLAVGVLRRLGAVSANAASLNYLSEVGEVVLRTKGSDRYAVIEIATTGPGEIAVKAALVSPKIAALTVVQREHVKSFDSLEAIAAEKGELVLALPEDGVAVLNIDDPHVRSIGERARARCIWFGVAPQADLRLVEATSSWPEPLTLIIEYQGRQYRCVTAIHGKHLAVPVLAAIGIGLAAGLPIEECVEAVSEAATTPGRMQIVAEEDGVTFVRDDYKAPYWSFPAALEYLHDSRPLRKVAVIGTISDYSISASKLYPKVARLAKEAADLVVFVGPHALRALKARQTDDDRALVGFTEIEEAHRFLQSELREGDLVLLKGSNHADHLVRLMLARKRPVGCWASGGGWNRFCDACSRLDDPVRTAESSAYQSSVGAKSADVEVDPSKYPPLNITGAADLIWLVIGMGNHGEGYDGTPHNVGVMAVDRLACQFGAGWSACSEGALCLTKMDGREVILFKPATLTNLCGPAVASVLKRYGLVRERVVIIHDDADLGLGDVRFKQRGSDGGHKGLRSIFSALGNDGVIQRVRVGIRRSDLVGASARSIVLERFSVEDEATLQLALDKIATQILTLVESDQGGALIPISESA
jgi:aminoacyl-tRNA hydrolase